MGADVVKADGINNTRNSHNWAQDNPHGTIETNFQTRFSVNVWCGIIKGMLIGPVIIEHRMTGDSYLHFLQNDLPEQTGRHSLGYKASHVPTARWSTNPLHQDGNPTSE